MNQPCFHCGLPVKNANYQAELLGSCQSFCCTGCKLAALTINDSGLADFYSYRDQFSENAEGFQQKDINDFKIYDDPDIQEGFVHTSDNQQNFSLQIEGITCAACVWLIEHSLQQLPNVNNASLNLSNHRLSIDSASPEHNISNIFATIQGLGYGAKPWKPGNHQHLEKTQKDFLIRIGISGIGMMQVMMNTFAIYLGNIEPEFESLLRWASLVLTLPVFFYAAIPFYKAALRDIKSRHFGMDVPVSIALILSFIPSVWATITESGDTYYESVVMFTFFLLVGRYLEFRSRLRLDQSGDGLDDLIPAFAHIIKDSTINDIASIKLVTGDIIEVRPGEQLPADGEVISGESQINESSITGEFNPVTIKPGQLVRAGTINTDGLFQMKVSQAGHQSTVSQMLTLLEKASSQRPKIAELANKGASYFVLMVLFLSIVTGLVWLYIDPDKAFWVAVSVLVITCPCALSLATPVSITSSITALRKLGILLTRGEALTELNKVTTVVFDKTGTLTKGEFSISEIINLSDLSEEKLLAIAASLESHSEHPIARAFVSDTHLQLSQTDVVTNKGVSGVLNDIEYRIGSIDFCLENNLKAPDNRQWIALSDTSNQKLLAWFQINDVVRADVDVLIDKLKSMNLKIQLLTGDPSNEGNRLGELLQLDSVQTGLSAKDKFNVIQKLQQNGESVLMIGDGINDALALSVANTSIAMASGTELSKNSADFILLNHQLIPVFYCIKVAKKTSTIISQNLSWGLLYNIIALPFAMMGVVTPWMAAIGMSFSSLLVVFNAMRLTKTIKK